MATITRSIMTQYNASNGGIVPDGMIIRDVPDFIPLISRTDTPLIKKLKSGPAIDQLKIEWGQGDLPQRTIALSANVTAGASSASFDVPTALQQYDIIRFPDGEQARVTGASPANPVALVKHPGGGTLSAHTSGDKVQILGPAVPEGADSPDSPTSAGDLFYNYPQILEYTWKNSHRSRVTKNYEFMTDRFKAELKRKMVEGALDLESFAIYGQKSAGAGGGTDPSTTGGVLQFTTANVVPLSGAALTLKSLNDAIDAIAQKVGPGDTGKYLVGNSFMKRVFNSLIAPTRRANMEEKTMNLVVDQVQLDVGTFKFVTHYNWPAGQLNLINLDDCSRRAYEGGNWTTGVFSTQGWYDRGFVRGDFGFQWEAPDRRSAITGISTTATDYPNLDKFTT